MFAEAGIDRVRRKSLQLTHYLIFLIERELIGYGFMIGSPLEYHRRGGHVYLEHPEAARICKALKANGVIPDFRAPNGIRFAPVALYTTFEEIWKCVQILKEIMETGLYKQYENTRDVVA